MSTLKNIIGLLILILVVRGQNNISANGCYQEGITAYGNFTNGQVKTDLGTLDTLSAKHRLYEIKTCTNGKGALNGIQVTAAISEGSVIRDKVKLNAFGNFTSPCTSDVFATGEIVRDFVFYYLDSKVLGISYTTSAGNAKAVGLI